MPFQGNRIFIIAIVVAVIVIGSIVVATQGPPKAKTDPTPTPLPPSTAPTICTVTIQNGVGVANIRITNMADMSSFNATLTDLPFSFHCKPGEQIRFTVTAQQGYMWNSWKLEGTEYNHIFKDGRILNGVSTLIISVDADVSMTPCFNMVDS